MTDIDSFSSADGVNPPASSAESTSVNSQNDVSTGSDLRVNLSGDSVNSQSGMTRSDAGKQGIPLVRSGAPGAQGWMSGDGTILLGPYAGKRMLDWALDYAAQGWFVFQMRQGSKGFHSNCSRCTLDSNRYDADAHAGGSEHCTLHPEGYARCHGLWSATRDPEVIKQWWTEYPHGNIGINCGLSGIACVDTDIKHDKGKFGDRSMAAIESKYGPFPVGPRAVTASGGWHWVFRLPEDRELRSSTGTTHANGSKKGLADHIDIKAVGGLMVAAPSLVFDSKIGEVVGQYRWDDSFGGDIPDLPSWVMDEIAEREKRQATTPPSFGSIIRPQGGEPADRDEVMDQVYKLADEVATASAGGRNDLLLKNAKQAFQYAEAGQVGHHEVQSVFEQAALASGMDQSDFHTITNARNYAKGKPYEWKKRFGAAEARQQYDNWKGVPAPRQETAPDAGPALQTDPEPEVPDAENEPFETRDEFAERMTRISDAGIKKNEARKRVKQLAAQGLNEEERQEERDFLKSVCKLTAGDFKALYASAARSSKPMPDGSDTRPVYVMGDELRDYANLIELIENGVFPETYVRDGKLVHVQPVSGVRVAKGKISTSTFQAKDITPATLRRLVATYTMPYRQTKEGADSPLPTRAVCESVLDNPEWDGIDTLHGLTDAPFVRADGTICQEHGFDPVTGMWLALPSGYRPVPDNPTEEDVQGALDLIVNQVLRDFPFATTADRANAIGMLVTPMIRNITACPIPLQLISAHTAGTGKTLLAQIAAAAHGGDGYTFPRNSDEELRKSVTSILMDQTAPVVYFDNIATGSTIESPALAALLTAETWKDRVLGANSTVTLPNDKMWCATGNNLKVNTDISTRAVLIHLDAGAENPDERPTDSFQLGDMLEWLAQSENRAALVRALLVLIRSWAAAGMPKSDHAMRTFTPWARAVGGLLAHHGITDFLGNRDAVKETDEDKQQDALFLQKWHEFVGDEWISASDLITKQQTMEQARYVSYNGIGLDPWQGSFPLRSNGKPYSAIGFGKWLGARKDTPVHGYALRRRVDPVTNRAEWRVERLVQDKGPLAEQVEMFHPDLN